MISVGCLSGRSGATENYKELNSIGKLMFHVKQARSSFRVKQNVSRETCINWEMMTVSIFVFNSTVITSFNPDEILRAISGSNLQTLSHQYGLSDTLIPSALEALRVEIAPEKDLFALHTNLDSTAPIIVSQTVDDGSMRKMISATPASLPRYVASVLTNTQALISVDLLVGHLKTIGLLFAYELARWAAFEGQGVIYGLDRRWYCLNRHQAFIPCDRGGLIK